MQEDIEYLKDICNIVKSDPINTMTLNSATRYHLAQAIETVLKEFERLKEENTDLKELYVRVTKNIKEKGNLELAEYMLAQIEATPTFTTWEDYKTWVSKDKIRAKIEELEKDLQDFEQTDNTGRFIRTKSRDYDKKKALEELLEEE